MTMTSSVSRSNIPQPKGMSLGSIQCFTSCGLAMLSRSGSSTCSQIRWISSPRCTDIHIYNSPYLLGLFVQAEADLA